MTMDNAQVTVTQADREAAARAGLELGRLSERDAEACQKGGTWDEWSLVLAFARHRLERSEPVGWMGIESAPKDGSVFFAWCPNVGRVIMNIDGVHRNTWAVDRTYRLGCNPTHWMPLPSAPATTPPEPVAEIERLRDVLAYIAAEAASSVSSHGEVDVHAFGRIEKNARAALKGAS